MAVRVGGEFFFDPQPADASRNLVLIAGGVGINPLLSILRHAADLHRDRANKGSGYEIGTVKLFYSAKSTSELLFKVREKCMFHSLLAANVSQYQLPWDFHLSSVSSATVQTKGLTSLNLIMLKCELAWVSYQDT